MRFNKGIKKKIQFVPVLLGFVLTKLSLFRGPMKHFSSIDSAFTHLCVWKKRSLFSVVTNITEKISISCIENDSALMKILMLTVKSSDDDDNPNIYKMKI